MRPRPILLILAAALAGAACSGTVSDTDANANADADAGIPVQDAELVAVGETLYQAHCAECHGVDLRGTDRGPSHLSIVYEPSHHGDGAFLLAASRGVPQHHWPFGDMPPMPELTTDDLEAIIAFVRETQRIEGFEPYPP